jgi:basic amino acid/polyamine antiporter, APA family
MLSTLVASEKRRATPLHKRLGVAFGISITVGSTIGVGILRTPGTIAALLPDKSLIMACWLLAGGYILLAANSFAELTTMLPRAGGAFNYIKRAFGPFAGFVAGWLDFISNALSPAIFGLILGEYTGLLFPALQPYAKAVGAAYLTVFTLLNLPGVKSGSVVQQLTSALKIGLLLVLAVGCFWATPAAEPIVAATPAVTGTTVAGWALVLAFFKALQLILSTYDGWMAVSFFAEEDDNPGRNIPLSYFIGVLVIIGLYVLLNAAILYILPLPALAHSPVAASLAAAAAFGSRSAALVTIISIFIIISILNASLMIPARILFGLSREGYFIAPAMKVNVGGTPYVALMLCYALALWGIVANSFEQLFALGAVILMLVTGGALAALFRLRATEPTLSRPYRAWGYPYAPAFALLVTGVLLIGFAVSDPRSLLIVGGLLLVSYPGYRLLTHPTRRRLNVE